MSLVPDEAEHVDTAAANVDTERMLWLLYRLNVLNVLIEVFVLATALRQLVEAGTFETLATARPLRMLVGDAAGCSCCCSHCPV